MHIVELETELASSTLSQKLAEAGFQIQCAADESKQMAIAFLPEQVTQLAGLLTDFVFTEWQYEWIVQKLGEDHSYLTDDELEYVALLTYHALRKTEEPLGDATRDEWYSRVSEGFETVLEHTMPIHVDGIMRFRGRAYLNAVEEAIHEMVEQFLSDREYEEFVAMLRFMLEGLKETEQTLHVFCTAERVWICNPEGQLVRDPEVTAAAHASHGNDLNAEDLAMSILITRSPCKIIIHDLYDDAPWPSFSETVERVFLGRAERCNNCSTCQQLRQAKDLPTGLDEVSRMSWPNPYEK